MLFYPVADASESEGNEDYARLENEHAINVDQDTPTVHDEEDVASLSFCDAFKHAWLWLLCFCVFVGVGSGLTTLNHYAQVCAGI